MTDVKKQLGKRIKELRKLKEISQAELGESIGIEPNNVSKIESGKNYPTPENLAKIASVLGVDIFQLFFFNHQKNYAEMKKELFQIINEDEELTRIIYKFYSTLKL